VYVKNVFIISGAIITLYIDFWIVLSLTTIFKSVIKLK